MFFPVAGDSFRKLVRMQLYMTGGNNGTTFLDLSPAPITVTAYNGAVTSTAQSKFLGSSGYFPLSGFGNNYLGATVPQIGEQDFCVEMWLFPIDGGGENNAGILSITTGSPTWGSLWILKDASTNPMRLLARVNSQSQGTRTVAAASSSTECPNDTWTHIALSRANNTYRFFINGTLVSTVTDTEGKNIIRTEFHLGNVQNLGAGYKGYMQDFRLTIGVARYVSSFTVFDLPSSRRETELPVITVTQSSFLQISRLGL